MANKEDFVEVNSKDEKDNEVTVWVKKPATKDYKTSQVEYNRAFREALEGGAILKKKLGEYMRSQGLWDDAKDSEERTLLDQIASLEGKLKKGGIPLQEAKEKALELRKVRVQFRNLIAERTLLDSNTVEGQADNARFNALVVCCVLNEDKSTPKFEDVKGYDKVGAEPWAIEAASELASLMYELDPDYDNTLEENKFLKNYNFANKENHLVNSDGHPIFLDTDEDGDEVERLVDEDLRFIAYRTDEGYQNQDPEDRYYVNREGAEVDKEGELTVDEFTPFLDGSGKPVPPPVKEEEESSDEVAETSEEDESGEDITEETAENTESDESPEKPAPKKKGRPKKTEEVT